MCIGRMPTAVNSMGNQSCSDRSDAGQVVSRKGRHHALWELSLFTQNSLSEKLYKTREISERHRHRYEFNNEFRAAFEKAGLRVSGSSPDGLLVEMIELPAHKFFVGCQFHPEFKSRPATAHPLFAGLIKNALEYGRGTGTEMDVMD